MIRPATETDLPRLKELWLEFEREIPPLDYVEVDYDEEFREIETHVRKHVALLAERDGEIVGFLLAREKGRRVGFVSDLYVVGKARRGGVAAALMREAIARLQSSGAEMIELEVMAGNRDARTVYERWGMRETELTLAARADELEARLSGETKTRSFGSVHVQTDDRAAVERAVERFVPRLGQSEGTVVSAARNGWIAVYDELCDREPSLLRRLARELSDRMGAVVLGLGLEEGAVVRYILFDRGRVADEYASLPEYHGPLPPGDVIALRANPTVAARLTGADPGRVRDAASSDPAFPAELLAKLAAALGVEGAEHGYEG